MFSPSYFNTAYSFPESILFYTQPIRRYYIQLCRFVVSASETVFSMNDGLSSYSQVNQLKSPETRHREDNRRARLSIVSTSSLASSSQSC
jgi:hypothetical protein